MVRPRETVVLGLCTVVLLLVATPCGALPIAGRYPSREIGLKQRNSFEDDALKRINANRRNHKLPALAWDPRLSAVAREHSKDMAAHNYFDYAPPRLGTFAYRQHRAGSSVANARYAIYRTRSVNTLMQQMDQDTDQYHLGKITHIGIGIVAQGSPRGLHATLISCELHSTLEPFPTRPLYGKSYRLKGRIDKDYKEPRVIIILPDGSTTEQKPTFTRDGVFNTIVTFNKRRGKYIVEVVAIGPMGPAVLNMMHCYAGVSYPKPRVAGPSQAPPKDLRKAEREMYKLVNQARKKAGLKPVAYDTRLAEVARRHSTDMVENRFFAHISPTQGVLTDRMKRAAYAAIYSTENLAVQQTVLDAHEGLMGSPGHRKNILDPKVTHVGIGIVRARNEGIVVTQNFAQAFPEYDTNKLASDFIKAVNETRSKKGLPKLRVEAELSRIALDNSKEMGRKRRLGHARAEEELKKARLRYGVWIGTHRSYRPLTQDKLPLSLERKYNRIGVGIVQTKSATGVRRLWATVLLGE